MTMPQTQVTQVQTGATSANTNIDLSGHMPASFDVRGSNDPIVNAEYQDEDTAGGGTDLTSIGQGASGDPAAGEIAVTDDHTVALGDALAAGDVLVITYEARNQGNLET